MRIDKLTLVLIFSTLLLCSCSGNNDQKKEEKGKIETMTEQAGQEAVKAIKTPMEKAQTAADAASQRAKETDAQKKE